MKEGKKGGEERGIFYFFFKGEKVERVLVEGFEWTFSYRT